MPDRRVLAKWWATLGIIMLIGMTGLFFRDSWGVGEGTSYLLIAAGVGAFLWTKDTFLERKARLRADPAGCLGAVGLLGLIACSILYCRDHSLHAICGFDTDCAENAAYVLILLGLCAYFWLNHAHSDE